MRAKVEVRVHKVSKSKIWRIDLPISAVRRAEVEVQGKKCGGESVGVESDEDRIRE